MRKIFSEYGNVIMVCMAVVSLIGVLVIALSPRGGGWIDNAYHEVVDGFSDKVNYAIDGELPNNENETNDDGLLKCYYKHRSNTGIYREQFDVYIPSTVGYLNVNFLHSVYATSNYDIWRLNQMSAVDDDLVKRYDITNTGEFEAAIRLQDRTDFSGGSQHGDEMLTSVSFYIDGELTDITSLTDYRSFTEMRIVRDSMFYDPADHTTEIATHYVEYIINKDGVRINQNVSWLVDATCDMSYLAMFPVLRTTTDANGNTVAISKYYTDDKKSEVYDVLEAGKAEYPQIFKAGARKILLTSDELGLESSLELVDITNVPGAGYSSCSAAEQYNKLYFTITGYGAGENYEVSQDEVWEATTHYAVNITQ